MAWFPGCSLVVLGGDGRPHYDQQQTKDHRQGQRNDITQAVGEDDSEEEVSCEAACERDDVKNCPMTKQWYQSQHTQGRRDKEKSLHKALPFGIRNTYARVIFLIGEEPLVGERYPPWCDQGSDAEQL